jgi:hypothetical protein
MTWRLNIRSVVEPNEPTIVNNRIMPSQTVDQIAHTHFMSPLMINNKPFEVRKKESECFPRSNVAVRPCFESGDNFSLQSDRLKES